ncbi:flagellar basal body P-ring formation chaperone FlgA [Oligoflexia bacterium]|nr:flagellar basal body P-ring formation chaperone FlgA [Oligoflexia bacterium]
MIDWREMEFVILGSCLYLMLCIAAYAEEGDVNRSIRAVGRKTITVTTNTIRLGDLAHVSSRHIADDDSIIGLQKIYIEQSPIPGKSITISAAQVLDRLKEEGVDLQEIGYAIPRIMTVKRASRIIALEEIRAAIEEALHNSKREITLKSINYNNDVHVAPGNLKLAAQEYHTGQPGQMSFAVTAKAEQGRETKFNVVAIVDEWLKVPVARRPLRKGSVVSDGDVMMARLNLAAMPTDVEHLKVGIIGYETSRDISYGEVFRKNKLVIPPVIDSGARVTLMYQSRLFRATASGIALESGAIGDSIRVKNDGSKKIIVGTIIEPGLVGVKP